MTKGKGADLLPKETLAIIHHNYQSLAQYIDRMNRYTDIQSKLLLDKGYKFIWKDLIKKPLSEFLGRYFAGEGYKDGLHGLALATLQAFSEFILYLKLWQAEEFLPQAISLEEISKEIGEASKEMNWWLVETHIKTKGVVRSLPLRLYRKFFQKNG
jgi:hypothetical protein